MELSKQILIGQYIPLDSWIHSLDARVKIALVLVLSVIIFFVDTGKGLGLCFAFLLLGVLLSRIPFFYFVRGMRVIAFLVLTTALLNLFLVKGETVWSWQFLTISKEGVQISLLMSSRLLFLFGVTSLLTLTTSPIALTDGTERVLFPLTLVGFPAHELALMMTIALRFVPTLLLEAEKITKAQMARGADFAPGGLAQKAKSLVPLLVPLFVSAFHRADELATAMEARCYRGGKNRTRMKELRSDYNDLVAVLLVLGLVCLLQVV
ncbi:MAG: energy-coupling factor transporter transmembrane protein EcfT [Armatimonadetes bacterium]|nr:energy-coupling factor transporter transmembrane protein EcfT [Armatimonadota bacterium]